MCVVLIVVILGCCLLNCISIPPIFELYKLFIYLFISLQRVYGKLVTTAFTRLVMIWCKHKIVVSIPDIKEYFLLNFRPIAILFLRYDVIILTSLFYILLCSNLIKNLFNFTSFNWKCYIVNETKFSSQKSRRSSNDTTTYSVHY